MRATNSVFKLARQSELRFSGGRNDVRGTLAAPAPDDRITRRCSASGRGSTDDRHRRHRRGAVRADRRIAVVGVLMVSAQSSSPTAAESNEEFDATVTDLPLLAGERIWNFWQHSSVNVGLAVATWAFLQGAAVAYYVGVKQAIASIVIGYGISVLLVALAPCMPSVKYGIEQFVGLRSTFGERGARLVMVVVSTLLAAAWSAVLAIMFGHGLVTVVNQLFGMHLSES